MSNDSLFGEGHVAGTPDKESPLACVADYDCTDETSFGMLMENDIISVCNMQSREKQFMENTALLQRRGGLFAVLNKQNFNFGVLDADTLRKVSSHELQYFKFQKCIYM